MLSFVATALIAGTASASEAGPTDSMVSDAENDASSDAALDGGYADTADVAAYGCAAAPSDDHAIVVPAAAVVAVSLAIDRRRRRDRR